MRKKLRFLLEKSDRLDRSEYILLATDLLRRTRPRKTGDEALDTRIMNLYGEREYDTAIRDLQQRLRLPRVRFINDPRRMHTLRVFNTGLALNVLSRQEETNRVPNFEAFNNLVSSMQEIDDEGGLNEKGNLREKKWIKQHPDETNAESLVRKVLVDEIFRVTSSEDAESVIALIRDFAYRTCVQIEDELRAHSPLSSRKDRGPRRATDTNPVYSKSKGIIDPNYPVGMHRQISGDEKMVKKNKVTDSFDIDRSKRNGYSANSQHPFVNSVSGTTFSFVALMTKHIAILKRKGVSKDRIQDEINDIFKIFVAFTCKEGYHCFAEMLDVMKEPSVLFALGDIQIDLRFYDNASLKEAFDDALRNRGCLVARADCRKQLRRNPTFRRLKENAKVTEGPRTRGEYIQFGIFASVGLTAAVIVARNLLGYNDTPKP